VRKTGLEEAQRVQQLARDALDFGGLQAAEGISAVADMDEVLQEKGGKLNPGTTADILGATLFVACLCGFRP
jgi:triphosphoribosyl-dephospho-CoA synthetase